MARVGRPAEREAAKLAPLNMRTSPQLREQIEQAATVNGRSLTQEVERRLITSFIFDDSRGGAHIGSLANMICASIQMIEQETGKRWTEDFDTFTQASSALNRLLRWKNPGADLGEHFDLMREQMDAQAEVETAEQALALFRAERGLIGMGALGQYLVGQNGEAGKLRKTRREWSDEDLEAESRLEDELERARQRHRDKRTAQDEWMAKTMAEMEKAEAKGTKIADVIFDQIGPRG